MKDLYLEKFQAFTTNNYFIRSITSWNYVILTLWTEKLLGFIKSTDHRPTDHQSLTNRPTDTLTTDLPKRLYFKDLMIKK